MKHKPYMSSTNYAILRVIPDWTIARTNAKIEKDGYVINDEHICQECSKEITWDGGFHRVDYSWQEGKCVQWKGTTVYFHSKCFNRDVATKFLGECERKLKEMRATIEKEKQVEKEENARKNVFNRSNVLAKIAELKEGYSHSESFTSYEALSALSEIEGIIENMK